MLHYLFTAYLLVGKVPFDLAITVKFTPRGDDCQTFPVVTWMPEVEPDGGDANDRCPCPGGGRGQ